MEAIVFIILQIFLRVVLKNGECSQEAYGS